MSFKEETKQWYYTVKTMNDNIENRQLYSFFLTTNYQNIKNGHYNWKKGIGSKDEKALLRLINADLMSHVIRNIESLLSLAKVGILAWKKGINHGKMNRWYFSKNMKEIGKTIDFLKNNDSLDIWKWVLWILDLEELKEQLNLSSNEIKVVSKMYNSMLERTKYVFNSASEFWNLYKPIRDAFSHKFSIVPSPENVMNIPVDYEDAILVFGHNWENNNPVEMAVLSGKHPMIEMANVIVAFNLYERVILENHIRSIKLDSKRILPNRIIGDIDKNLFSKYMNILQKTSKLKDIRVGFHYEKGIYELKKQDEIYRKFGEGLSKLGRKIPYKDVKETFQPTRKETRKLK
jgi:hypothetical protein